VTWTRTSLDRKCVRPIDICRAPRLRGLACPCACRHCVQQDSHGCLLPFIASSETDFLFSSSAPLPLYQIADAFASPSIARHHLALRFFPGGVFSFAKRSDFSRLHNLRLALGTFQPLVSQSPYFVSDGSNSGGRQSFPSRHYRSLSSSFLACSCIAQCFDKALLNCAIVATLALRIFGRLPIT
jgi:hypothetical protein